MNLFRALVAVVLLLNALAPPPAVAAHTPAPATATPSHDGHSPDAAPADPAASHGHHSADMAGGECCETPGCDCGCAAPQATTLPASVPRTSWGSPLPEFTFVVKSFHSDPLPAPFRPPA